MKIIKTIFLIMTTLLFCNQAYTNQANNQSINQLFPYQIDSRQNTYILIHQNGELVHSPNILFNQVEYFPFQGIWRGTQYIAVPWQEKKVIAYSFFDNNGQIVQMDNADIIYRDLGENRLLKYSDKDHRYLLTDKHGKEISKLDPQIINIEPYSSQLALATIKISDYKKRYGYLNLNGQWAIKPIYYHAGSFDGKYAQVAKSSVDYAGLTIDQKGNTIKRADEHSRNKLSNGYWQINVARNGGKWFSYYIIDPKNQILMKETSAQSITKDNYLLSSKKKNYILNTKTGKLTPYEDNFYIVDNLSTKWRNDIFWLKVKGKTSSESVYRLFDNELNVLHQANYQEISRFVYDNNYSWVKPEGINDYILIDSKGEKLSKAYYDIVTERYGDSYFTFERNNNTRNDILSANGQIVAYSQYISDSDNKWNCNKYLRVLYRPDGTPIYPEDLQQACLIEKSYYNIDDEENNNYVYAYMNKLNLNYSNRFYHYNEAIIQGPKRIDLDEDVTLNLPKGYVYLKQNRFDNCPGYIMSEDVVNDKWQICVDISNIGHVSSLGLTNMVQDSEQLRKNIIDSTNTRNNYYRSKTHDFNWLLKPTFDNENHVLSWGYNVIHHRINSADKKYGHFYADTSLIKFGKSKVVWLKSNHGKDAKAVAKIINQFADLIDFNHDEAFENGENFACNLLPVGDKTLSKIQAYLPSSERCFSYPLLALLIGFNGEKNVKSNITDFISKKSMPHQTDF